MLQPRTGCFVTLSIIFTLINCGESGYTLKSKSHRLSPSSPYPNVEVYEIKRENVHSFSYNRNHFSRGQGQKSSNLQLINVTRNSDLLFGDVARKDSALLLQCEAPYSVQWVYMGDGDPEFNTNTTTETDPATGGRVYSAYLFLGARRTLNERETGKYICTSVRNKYLLSYLYIYVTNTALFTNKGQETVYYSNNDEYIRIPCSLSEPRATTTLQKKSNDGILQCPMNDTVRYDPKQGFILEVRRLQQPTGSYLCIADYNNSFQIIKYNVEKDDNLQNENNSGEFEESSEFEPEHVPGSISSGNCVKAKITCGLNAVCQTSRKGPERCKCIDGYGGNPYVECRPKSELPLTTSTTEPSSGEGQSCNSYDDCPFHLACFQKTCQDPCKINSICGPHTTCTTQHHTPFCECEEGYAGDPYSSQAGQRCEKKAHCNPNPCGANTVCKYVNGIISCSCQDGYATHNDGVCRPNHNKQELQSKPTTTSTTTTTTTITTTAKPTSKPRPAQIIQSQGQAKNPVSRPYLNRTIIPPLRTTTRPTTLSANTPLSGIRPRPPYQVMHLPPLQTANHDVIVVTTPRPPGFECYYDADCPDNRMCIHDKCEDPCVNACGAGARCTTRNHFPRCVCPEGTTGDPFYKCSRIYPRRNGGGPKVPQSPPRRPPQPPSKSKPQTIINGGTIPAEEEEGIPMTDTRFYANCGGKYSPCGPNSVCQTSRNRFVCACANDHAGDPYSPQGCYSKIGYQRCKKDEDCPHFLTCLRFQGCVNPCDIVNVCKPRRTCVPHLHKPACLKTANFDMEWQRDGLESPDDFHDDETKDTLEISEIPEELEGSRCFIKAGSRILSPCGRNAICYDDNRNGSEPFCGCMANHVGDPFIGCEPLPSCSNSTDCTGESETCLDGHCRVEGRKQRNACSPSPCKNPGERCAIDRETNTAICMPLGRNLEDDEELRPQPGMVSPGLIKPTKYLSRSDPCVLLGECDTSNAEEQQDDDIITTELVSEVTETSSASVEGSTSPSIERRDGIGDDTQFVDYVLNYSNEKLPVLGQSLRESRIVDAKK